MASIHPDADLAPEQELQSHRSSNPSVNDVDHDEETMPRRAFAEIKHNNYVYSAEIQARCPIIAKILKGHFIWNALTEQTPVPLIYVQQFWRTLEFHPDKGNHYFTARIDHFDTSFGVSKLR